MEAEVMYDGEDEGILMKRGVIIRHLLLPGEVEEAKKLLQALYEEFGNRVYYSIMNQYTPMESARQKNCRKLNRRVTEQEYDEVVDFAIALGVENGFIQEGETAKESFIPSFDCAGVLPDIKKY